MEKARKNMRKEENYDDDDYRDVKVKCMEQNGICLI